MGQIVHFGLGNFARAHILDYTADAGGWDVVGVSLRSPLVRDGLAAQDFSYNLSIQGKSLKRISILKDVLVASEGAQSFGRQPYSDSYWLHRKEFGNSNTPNNCIKL